MQRTGVDQIFFAGTSLTEMVKFVHERYGKPRKRTRSERRRRCSSRAS